MSQKQIRQGHMIIESTQVGDVESQRVSSHGMHKSVFYRDDDGLHLEAT